MAHFNYRAHNGISGGYAHVVRNNAHELAKQAAEGVQWNRLGGAPAGFKMTNVSGRMRPVHEKTGIVFKPGFQMQEVAGNQQWEGNATSGGLRLDLQSVNNGWANWAVQTNGQNSVTVAVCLMEVEKCFSQNQLAHGLIQSAHRVRLCELTQ